MKYRIVKLPMWKVCGLVEWYGYSECYVIERKVPVGMLRNQTAISRHGI